MKAREWLKIGLLFLFFALFFPAFAAEKPDLSMAQIIDQVECPNNSEDICLVLRVGGDSYYVVQGKGYNKEENIWVVDIAEVLKANDETPIAKYLTLVWSRNTI